MADDALRNAKIGLQILGGMQELQGNKRALNNRAQQFSVSSPFFSSSATFARPQTDMLESTIKDLTEVQKERDKIAKSEETIQTVLGKNDIGKQFLEAGLRPEIAFDSSGTVTGGFKSPKQKSDLDTLTESLQKMQMAQRFGIDPSQIDSLLAGKSIQTSSQPVTSSTPGSVPLSGGVHGIPLGSAGSTGLTKTKQTTKDPLGTVTEEDLGAQALGAALTQNVKQEAKSALNAVMTTEAAKPFLGAYQLALSEIKEEVGSEVDSPTLLGAALRMGARVRKSFGTLPETGAFSSQIQAFATPLAKAAGEDRLTNEDIERFTAILPDVLGASTEENIKKIRNLVISLEYKSGTDEETRKRIRQNFATAFKQSGGPLEEAGDLIESFDADVKVAGDKIDGVDISSDDINDLANKVL